MLSPDLLSWVDNIKADEYERIYTAIFSRSALNKSIEIDNFRLLMDNLHSLNRIKSIIENFSFPWLNKLPLRDGILTYSIILRQISQNLESINYVASYDEFLFWVHTVSTGKSSPIWQQSIEWLLRDKFHVYQITKPIRHVLGQGYKMGKNLIVTQAIKTKKTVYLYHFSTPMNLFSFLAYIAENIGYSQTLKLLRKMIKKIQSLDKLISANNNEKVAHYTLYLNNYLEKFHLDHNLEFRDFKNDSSLFYTFENVSTYQSVIRSQVYKRSISQILNIKNVNTILFSTKEKIKSFPHILDNKRELTWFIHEKDKTFHHLQASITYIFSLFYQELLMSLDRDKVYTPQLRNLLISHNIKEEIIFQIFSEEPGSFSVTLSSNKMYKKLLSILEYVAYAIETEMGYTKIQRSTKTHWLKPSKLRIHGRIRRYLTSFYFYIHLLVFEKISEMSKLEYQNLSKFDIPVLILNTIQELTDFEEFRKMYVNTQENTADQSLINIYNVDEPSLFDYQKLIHHCLVTNNKICNECGLLNNPTFTVCSKCNSILDGFK